MARRKAIVDVAGQLTELPVGDSLDVLGSSTIANLAFSNTAAIVSQITIPANTLETGAVFELFAAGSVINTTAASNLTVDVLLNNAVIATVALALGVTAFAAGRGFFYDGKLVVRAIGASGSVIAAGQLSVDALVPRNTNSTAAPALNTTVASTLALRVATNAASSTGTVRLGFVGQVL